MQSYLVFFDKRFLKEVMGELKLIAGSSYKIERYVTDDLIEIESESTYEEMKKGAEDSIFIERVFPVEARLGTSVDESFVAGLKKVLEKACGSESIRLEVLKQNSPDERNAKSIEVVLGNSLEKLGMRADMKNPSYIVFIVLGSEFSYISISRLSNPYESTLDHFRKRNVDSDIAENRINRAEFKIYEAFGKFGIKLPENAKGLDIGASPGGWSRFMLKTGARVVAVDPGAIDYSAMPKGTKTAIVGIDLSESDGIDAYSVENAPEGMDGYGLIHFKERFEQVKLSTLKRLGPFDIVCIDINIPAVEASVIAAVCAETLNTGGLLLLTLKMTDDNVLKNIERSKTALSEEYGNMKVKKLPHDRKELTLFAVKL